MAVACKDIGGTVLYRTCSSSQKSVCIQVDIELEGTLLRFVLASRKGVEEASLIYTRIGDIQLLQKLHSIICCKKWSSKQFNDKSTENESNSGVYIFIIVMCFKTFINS